MFSRNTFKIVDFLLRNIQEYNINETARELKISVGSAHKILKSLEEDKVIKAKKLGNAIYYRLNLESKEARKLSELVLIDSKGRALDSNPQASIYAKDLQGAEGFTKAAALFGSIVDKKQAKDIDVLFITKRNAVKRVENFCLRLSSLRMRKIAPLIMTSNDLKNNIKKRDKVILDIFKKGIIIYGEDKIVEILRSI